MVGRFTQAVQVQAPLIKKENAPNEFSSSMSKWALPIIIGYLLLGATAFWGLEGPETMDWGTAMYWTIMTITTVGYGDVVPQTDGGKIFTIVFIFFGLSIVAACVGLLAAQVARMSEGTSKESARDRTTCGDLKTIITPMFMMVANILIMALFLHYNENVDWVTSFYWAMVSLSSVGYGDPTVEKESTRNFLSIFILWGVASVAWALGKIAEVVRLIEEDRQMDHFVEHGVTKTLIREMDDDNNGSVDRNEFLLHMLVKLNRVRQADVTEILSTFDSFDADGSGSIDEDDIDLRNNSGSKNTDGQIEKGKPGFLEAHHWETDPKDR